MLRSKPVKRLAFVIPVLLVGCAAHPPAGWAQGGVGLGLPHARWDRGDATVDLLPDGRVLIAGEHLYSLDAAGRVYGPEGEPFALLGPEGQLVGRDDQALGVVGVRNASAPGAHTAWLTVGERGEVVRYDDEGERHSDGVWYGCGAALPTCTLATHLVVLNEVRRRPHVGFGFGVGIGIGR